MGQEIKIYVEFSIWKIHFLFSCQIKLSHLYLSNNLSEFYDYIYIYICIEREREREDKIDCVYDTYNFHHKNSICYSFIPL